MENEETKFPWGMFDIKDFIMIYALELKEGLNISHEQSKIQANLMIKAIKENGNCDWWKDNFFMKNAAKICGFKTNKDFREWIKNVG